MPYARPQPPMLVLATVSGFGHSTLTCTRTKNFLVQNCGGFLGKEVSMGWRSDSRSYAGVILEVV
eukprot:6200151-Amphidinium_carterae.1